MREKLIVFFIFLLNFRINYVRSVTSNIESNEKVIKKIQRWVKFPNIVFMISKSWYLIISMTTHKATIQNYVLSHIKVLILKRKRKIIPSRPHPDIIFQKIGSFFCDLYIGWNHLVNLHNFYLVKQSSFFCCEFIFIKLKVSPVESRLSRWLEP